MLSDSHQWPLKPEEITSIGIPSIYDISVGVGSSGLPIFLTFHADAGCKSSVEQPFLQFLVFPVDQATDKD